MALAAPLPIEVSEDGTTSTILVSLAATPLSTVRIAFSSRWGRVTTTPQVLILDYTNYSTPATVSVAAVDNDIDHGESRSDTLHANVFSEDSTSECEAAATRGLRVQGHLACGQAVPYNGFGIEDMKATVFDDDVAGVIGHLPTR